VHDTRRPDRVPHPTFSYFGPDPLPTWPRILVIGQEPDAHSVATGEAGPYDLPGGGKVPFWTWSHRAIARAAGREDLWWAAKTAGSSPIAYADASPVGYEVGVGAIGPKPTPQADELRAHAASLLALPQTTNDACPVVIISGLAERYRPFYDLLESVCRERGTIVVVTRFFGYAPGARADVLVAPLLHPDIQPCIRGVVERWAHATRAPVVPG